MQYLCLVLSKGHPARPSETYIDPSVQVEKLHSLEAKKVLFPKVSTIYPFFLEADDNSNKSSVVVFCSCSCFQAGPDAIVAATVQRLLFGDGL